MSRFLENAHPRIRVLWKTRLREFSFCGKRESENSRFVENQNRRIFFFFFSSENSRSVENGNWRIFFFFHPRTLVLWKTGTGEFFFFFIREFSFCGKKESENIFFFFLSENSLFVENGNWRIFFFSFFYPRILVLWKTGTGEFFFFFFFFIRELSF